MQVHIFSYDVFQRQPHIFKYKKHELFSGAATDLLKHKKYLLKSAAHFLHIFQNQPHVPLKAWNILGRSHTQKNMFRSSCTNFHGCCTKHHTLREDFHNLSMVMKTSLMDGCKTLFRNLTALDEYHRPRHDAYRNRQIIQACFALCHHALIIDPKAYFLGLVNIF